MDISEGDQLGRFNTPYESWNDCMIICRSHVNSFVHFRFSNMECIPMQERYWLNAAFSVFLCSNAQKAPNHQKAFSVLTMPFQLNGQSNTEKLTRIRYCAE